MHNTIINIDFIFMHVTLFYRGEKKYNLAGGGDSQYHK